VETARDLFDAAPCGILEYQDDGRILAANLGVQRALGYSQEEIAALKFDDLLTVSSRIFHQTHFFPLLRLHGRAEEIYLALKHKEDRPVPMLANAVRGESNGRQRIVCAFMPVHQRQRYEEEILLARRKAEEALNSNEALQRSRAELESRLRELDRNEELLRLNQIMSHDLREPVRKIRTFLGLMLQENVQLLSPNGTFAAQRISASCDRIQSLIQTLQEFLWVDTSEEHVEVVNLEEVLNAARRGIETRAQIRAIPLPAIAGFRSQLKTLFERLLLSAVERAPEGQPVEIEIGCAIVQHNTFRTMPEKYSYADFAQITVRDNGKAFDCRDCNSLFQLLRKSGDGQSHPDLAVCQRIVDNHQGSISLESSERTGTTFTILLPLPGAEGRVL